MQYPTIDEYISSITTEEDFKTLRGLTPELDREGRPILNSGNFVVVFKMRDTKTGKLHAIKCFIKEQEGRIPNSVMWIENSAFKGCINLQTVWMSNNVMWIGQEAFRDCNFLQTIEIPEEATNIECKAFWGCWSLPKSVEEKIRRINQFAL
ncbi:MAG: leucine-rich repeat protein [Bacteroidales bacterium]|nr:leucine-rich repeat protein [Bacteroidales bacterium]